MASTDVSIVIVSWNTRDILRGCLESILDQARTASIEIIVVDNASADGSADMVRAEFPGTSVVANAENMGFAAANNQGMRLAKGRYVLFLNPDTIILEQAIDRMVEYMDVRPDVGCAGCQVLTDPTTVQMTCFRFPSLLNAFLSVAGLPRLFPRSRLFGRYWMDWWDRRSEQDVDVVSGMFMLVRREVIEQVGPMDEAFFVYAEEADWCYRFRRAGWRCVFTPAARIIHLDGGGKSTGQTSARMFVQQQKSMLIFHRKHYGLLNQVLLRLLLLAAMGLRYLYWRLRAVLSATPIAVNRATCAMAAIRYHLSGLEPGQ